MDRPFVRGLVLASLGLLVLVGVARLGSWPPWWWLEALDTFALYAFVPFVGTAVLAWRLRSRAFAEAGHGFGHTFPVVVPARRGGLWSAFSMPLLRIDYILTGPELQARGAWTEAVRGSGHLAVIADLSLKSVP